MIVLRLFSKALEKESKKGESFTLKMTAAGFLNVGANLPIYTVSHT
jgi:hypothetical protein